MPCWGILKKQRFYLRHRQTKCPGLSITGFPNSFQMSFCIHCHKHIDMKLLCLWLMLIGLTLITKDSEGQVRPTPPEVTSAFTKMFPDAGNVMWRDKITNFCVYFNIKDIKCEAKFGPDGKWLSTEKSIQWDSLPPFVTDS